MIFSMPANTKFPIHDHKGMFGISHILKGNTNII